MIIGSGCAGLFLADKLSTLGLNIALVEQSSKLSSGPTTRNGGFVHAGGFHAAVIDDEARAFETAMRCKKAALQLIQNFPEAIQTHALPIHLLCKTSNMGDRAINRWEKWGISYDELKYENLDKNALPLKKGLASLIARTNDFAINWRLVMQKLYFQSKSRGVEFFTDTMILDRNNDLVKIESKDTVYETRAKMIIYCTGGGLKELPDNITKNWDVKPTVNLWKSHVLVTPNFSKYGFLFTEPNEISAMPQGKFTLICQSQEDTPIENLDYKVIQDRVDEMKDKLFSTLDISPDLMSKIRSHACYKPTMTLDDDSIRHVTSQILQVSDTEIVAFPGKATEATLMADDVINLLDSDLVCPDITQRPGDLAWRDW